MAQQQRLPALEARARILLSTSQMRVFQYPAALKSLQQANALADSLPDKKERQRLSGSACGNMSTIYSELGDWPEADLQSARAVSYLKQMNGQDDVAKLLVVQALQRHADACFRMRKFAEGYKNSVEAEQRAQGLGDSSKLAFILDDRGVALAQENRIEEASLDLNKALKLSEDTKPKADQDGIAFSKEHLAELELKRAHPDLKRALQLIDDAFATPSPTFKADAQYYPIHIRARILEELGRKSEALSEYMRAVNSANEWRLGALPGDTTNLQTAAELDEVYADYAQLAAETALETHDNALAMNALQVEGENRAASLREQLQSAYTSALKMPPGYYSKLAELQSVQARVTLGQNNSEDKEKLDHLRLDISELENQNGLKLVKVLGREERISRRNSLRDIQHTLERDQVLLSITLGKSRSYLWAVTKEKVDLFRLPATGEITRKAALFASAVRAGKNTSASAYGLSRALFSGLSSEMWKRSEWVVMADGPLLNGIPFSALADLSSETYQPLAKSKSLRFVPSLLLLEDKQPSPPPANLTRSFLGVGDPIYNVADPRLARTRLADAKSVSGSMALARLLGSEKEIRSAARVSRSTETLLLTGANATRQDLSKALAHAPNVVHFAVHVVSPPDEPQQAALALSLKNGIPELLTSEVIASLHIPGSLVVLSGCSSGQGRVLPGAGLVGLSRAWLLAGAAAVVVSEWPTPDDSGLFFSSFYRYFEEIKTGDTAQRTALALRRTQADMLGGTGYSTSPSFWGAFAVISKE